MKGEIKNRIPEPVQVTLEDGTDIDDRLISYCFRTAEHNKLRYRYLKSYYQNRTAIQNRSIEDPDKPNNRISHAFARYITKIATAYFMGKGLRYQIESPTYKQALDDILNDNQAAIRHFEEAKEMSKCGLSYELLFINPNGKLKFQQYEADEIIPVFSASPGNFLSLALRPYTLQSLGPYAHPEQYVEIYTTQEILTYRRIRGSRWSLIDKRMHPFSDVPVIVRMNNAELHGDYEKVIPQIDGYDRAQSDTANDLDYFADAYLSMEGATDIMAEDEEGNELTHADAVGVMRRERILFPPEGGKVYFVTKQSDDSSAEHYKQRLYKDIFFISQVANLTDEAFAGNLSGVAIKYKLFGLEELALEKEAYFTSSEKKKVRLITEYLNTLHGTRYDWREVELSFDRSSIANEYEIAQTMQLLQDVLSDETVVRMWPGVKDAAAELERKREELALRENLEFPLKDEEPIG